jgi:hypothetical protein
MIKVIEFLTKTYFEPIVFDTPVEMPFLEIYHLPLTKKVGVWLFRGRTPEERQTIIKFVFGKDQLYVSLIPRPNSTSYIVPKVHNRFIRLEEFTLKANMNPIKALHKHITTLEEPDTFPQKADLPAKELEEFDKRLSRGEPIEAPPKDIELGNWFAARKVRNFTLIATWLTFAGTVGVYIYHKDKCLVKDSIIHLLTVNDAGKMFADLPPIESKLQTEPAPKVLDFLIKHFRPELII